MLVDIEYSKINPIKLREDVVSGKIIIIRQMPQVLYLKEQILKVASNVSDNPSKVVDDINNFYNNAIPLNPQSMYCFIQAIKKIRDNRYLSYLLSNLIFDMNFKEDVILDGGISRLAIDKELIQTYQDSGLFKKQDFKRDSSDGEVEMFMGGYANIHRDFNRYHSCFMCNFWIPLHSMKDDESLIFFPDVYHDNMALDTDNTADNRTQFGSVVQLELNFGDVLLFHAEHLHASPIPKIGHRRHSFDFRIISDSVDDGKHYRYNFFNLKNFSYDTNNKLGLEEYILSTNITHPNQMAIKLSKETTQEELIHYFEEYKKYQFAEDRFFKLLDFAFDKYIILCKQICDYCIVNTTSYFWSFKFFEFLQTHNIRIEDSKIKFYKTKIVNLAKNANFSFDTNPVKYKNPTTQLTPSMVLKKVLKNDEINCLAKSVQIDTNVQIGKKCNVQEGVVILTNTSILDGVSIGAFTGISSHVHIYNDCKIGKFSAIGANSVIAGPTHRLELMSISNQIVYDDKYVALKNYTIIGNDVWIGANVTIKANVNIGDGAVIGANSFVNSDIPPYAIAFGSPAKVYKYRFDNNIIERLLKLQWWNIPKVNELVIPTDVEEAIDTLEIYKNSLQYDMYDCEYENDKPLVLERNICGYNIIFYQGIYYGIPLRYKGSDIRFDNFGDDVLKDNSLENLKLQIN